jgi:hypothetical protein
MTVPYSFANASTTIPLSQLDSNFATPITLGNTIIYLGNTVSTLNNLTLGNVTISSGNVAFAIPPASGGTGLVSPGSTGNVLTSNGTAWVSTGVAPGSGVTALSFGTTGLTPSTSVGGNVTVAGTLVAGSGGTGLSSLTANSVLLGNGTSTIQFVSPGTTGNVLTSNGTSWLSSAPSSGGSGLTLAATLTLINGVGTYVVTGLPSYKSIIITMPLSTFSSASAGRFALSSDNGSTYGTITLFTNGSTTIAGFVQLFQTDASSAVKPYIYIYTSSNGAASYSSVTGTVNAISISFSSATFTSGGPVYIYGMN